MTVGERRRVEVLIAVLIVAALPLFIRRVRGAFAGFPWDFAINWTAAQGLRRHLPVYDPESLRALGVDLVGPRMEGTFRSTFNGYIGPPTTAALMVPFTALPFETAALVYKASALVGFLLAALVASLSLPPPDRRLGALLGVLFLVTSSSVTFSTRLGQLDAWVALALAAALWALSQSRNTLAGGCIALAALLKASPGIALLYALLRRQRRLAFAGALTGLAGLVLAALAARHGDTFVFVTRVLPALSKGSFGMENQSLTAWIARLVLPRADLTNFLADLGPVAPLAPLLLAGLLSLVFLRSRGNPFSPFELCLVVLAGLLAGPVTWTIYMAWAVVFAVRLADATLWSEVGRRGRVLVLGLLATGWACLVLPVALLPERVQPARFFLPEVVAAHGALRVLSGAHAFGLLCWFAAGLLLVPRRPARA